MFIQLSCSFYNEWLSFRYDFCFRTLGSFNQPQGAPV